MQRLPTWLVLILAISAISVCLPFVGWIVLAVWLGVYAKNLHHRIERRLHVGSRWAATLTILLLLIVIVPIAIVLTSLVLESIDFVRGLLASDRVQGVLVNLVSGDPEAKAKMNGDGSGIVNLLLSQGDRALALGRQLAGAAAHFVVGLLILITGVYGVLVNGPQWLAWIEDHGPLSRDHFHRFGAAFLETGRGLWFGIVGAGMIQSVVATIAYLVLGVPSALPLGMLTLLFSVIPAVGTAIVWVPVTAGLALTDRTGAAIAMGAIGVFLISTVDNLARPWLTRRGHLQLPTWVVLVAMFGGIELIGSWGLILGPLVVRLAKEALIIARMQDSPIVPGNP